MEREVEASTAMHTSTDAAQSVLRSDPALVLGEPDAGGRGGSRRYRTTIAAQLFSGTTVEQAVVVTIGPLQTTDADENTARFRWEPIGSRSLLPTFAGELVVSPGERAGSRLTVRGSYRAPLGTAGRFGDSVIGHRIARRSLTRYVEKLAERIDREAMRRHTTMTVRPAPYNDDLRARSRSEHRTG